MYAPILTESDLLLREQFESKTLENAAFRHREHVRLTSIHLNTEAPADVAARLCRSLLELATRHGVGHRFHYTLTVAWVHIIEEARQANPGLAFDELAGVCPWLLDKDAPLAYYSRDLLYSDEARQRWVEPNQKPLPGV